MKKTLHYPEGFQEQVNILLERLAQQGIKLVSPKSGQLSESALFRWLVEKELMELANGSNDAKRTTTPKASETKPER